MFDWWLIVSTYYIQGFVHEMRRNVFCHNFTGTRPQIACPHPGLYHKPRKLLGVSGFPHKNWYRWNLHDLPWASCLRGHLRYRNIDEGAACVTSVSAHFCSTLSALSQAHCFTLLAPKTAGIQVISFNITL